MHIALYDIMLYKLIGYQMISRYSKCDDLNYENHISRKIVLASRTIQHAFDLELRDKVGVTMAQWRVINTLTTQNGITQREIADKLGLDTSSLIPLIDRLEVKELVKRKPDPSDRRINRLYLTEKAEALLDPIYSCVLSIRKILTKDIPDNKLETTRQVMERINDNLVSHYGLYTKDNNCAVESTLADNSYSKRELRPFKELK
jgi:MarR family transcriptional regulator, transcriptional regulator for hemolysin